MPAQNELVIPTAQKIQEGIGLTTNHDLQE
jgi:hypothetical protein